MRYMRGGGLILGLLMLPAIAFGNPETDATRVVPEAYVAHVAELRSAFEAGSPRKLASSEWRLFERAEATIRRLLKDRETVESLPEKRQAELFSAQDTIQALVENRVDDRLLCRREGTTGSHMRQTKCMTAKQREIQEANAKEALDNRRQGNMLMGGSGG